MIGSETLDAIRQFLKLESSAGILLIAAAVLAIILDNSPFAWLYDQLLTLPFSVSIGTWGLSKPLLLWVNDGLMAVFFLLVGLEVKREILEGELSSKSQILLPAIAAAGGMIVPSGLYAALNWGDPVAIRGWAIPAATDIAFALGIISLLGSRVPVSLKILLTAIAIFDDLGAIIIIAVFYTADLSLLSLAFAAVAIAGLFILNRMRVTRLAPYILIGILLWVFVLKSGVHATLAGVALGLAIPLRAKDAEGHSPLRHLEHILHPWVAFAILPLFAFANAGLPLFEMSFADLQNPVSLGIALGLIAGKQFGVFVPAWLAIKSGLAELPEGTNYLGLYGMSVLTGIGFTMSLFIGSLAFNDPAMAGPVRIGILLGSIVCALLGYIILRKAFARRFTRA